LISEPASRSYLPEAARRAAARIELSRRPLIFSHVRLDGDAIGSELALRAMLQERGALPHAVNDGAIPKIYRFLPGVPEVGTSAKDLRDDYDLAICLDMASRERGGDVAKALDKDLPIVRIDHHLSYEPPGENDWTDTSFSSVGEMLCVLARAANWTISRDAAACLYVAIVTDTGRFTFPNTTPATFRAAAELLELGADHAAISEQLYQQEDPKLAALRADAVAGMTRHAGGRIAVMRVTRRMFERRGVNPIDAQNMADIPRSQAGVLVGVLLMEMAGRPEMKVSLRSAKGVDIEPVARRFDGGGHRQAAGCQIAGDLDAVERLVVAEATKTLPPEGAAP